MPIACPDAKLLGEYVSGRASSDDFAAIEEHLQGCAACQGGMAAANLRGDSLIASMRWRFFESSPAPEPELAEALGAIGDLQRLVSCDETREAPRRPGVPAYIRDYQLIEQLGEGGMGTVYLASHTRLDRLVAVKLLKEDRYDNPQAISRFEREMRAGGRVEHQHIVRTLDAGEERGVYFLVMEYISGVDLGRLVHRLGRLRACEACELIRQAALGLHHAHQNNLVHRDVKPSNLMLSGEGVVKVLDLGLAQLRQPFESASELTREDQMLGTHRYMAPEQFSASHAVDARADIYSLGVALYELLAGQLPLRQGQTSLDLPSLDVVGIGAPYELRLIVERMMAPAPEDRFASMGDVAERLAVLAAGAVPAELCRRFVNHSLARTRGVSGTVPVPSGPPPIPPPVAEPPRPPAPSGRRKAAMGLVAVASAIIGFAAVGINSTWRTNDATGVVEHPPNTPPAEPQPAAAPQPEEAPVDPDRDWPVLYAKIPDQPGAFVRYNGGFWRTGIAQPHVPYDAELRFVGEETVDEVPCCRFVIEIVSHATSGPHSESAVLVVDRDAYRERRELKVKRGWLTADSVAIDQRLEAAGLDADRLAARFDSEEDALANVAARLRLELPHDRLSAVDVLSLLFDYPSAASVRAALANHADREQAIEPIRIPFQDQEILCWVMKSEREPTFTYRLCGSPEIPFCFLEAKIDTPDFAATLKLKDYRNQAALPTPTPLDLDLLAAKFDGVVFNEQPFDRATLPDEDGMEVEYHGTVALGGAAKRPFVSLVRTLARPAEEPNLRWLEIDFESAGQQALFLIDGDAYRNDGFVLRRGYFETQDEVFEADGGDFRQVAEDLIKLGKPLPAGQLSALDLATLLFDADLATSRRLRDVRPMISGGLAEEGRRSDHKFQEIEGWRGGAHRLWADVWEKAPHYRIKRSREAPFDFVSVSLHVEHIIALDVHVRRDPRLAESDLVDEVSLATAAGQTRLRIAAEEADKNFHLWRTESGEIICWGEFGFYDDGEVVFWDRAKSETRWPRHNLHREDQRWIEGGRWWNISDERRYKFEGFRGSALVLRDKDGGKDNPSRGELSEADLSWIENQPK